MTDPIADLNRRLAVQRRYPLGLPPIPTKPVPFWWAIEGWGGYALGLIAFLACIVIAGW